MAFRGRGGYGRGRVGGYNRIPGKPFVLFPENVELPDRKSVAVDMVLLARNSRLRKYWSDSPYKIEETQLKKRERPDVETYSDMTKPRTQSKSDDLWQFIKRTQLSFPLELIKDGKGWARPQKKARWNPDAAMQRWDFFEKLDQKQQEQEEKGEKKKKEGESEDELEEEVVKEDEEYSDDGDYNQNIDFDDDEDDYNMEDDHDDEPTY